MVAELDLLSTQHQNDNLMSKWINEQLDAEVERVKSAGVKPLALTVIRTSVELDWSRPSFPVAANQLEVKTNFPFDNVKEVKIYYILYWFHYILDSGI